LARVRIPFFDPLERLELLFVDVDRDVERLDADPRPEFDLPVAFFAPADFPPFADEELDLDAVLLPAEDVRFADDAPLAEDLDFEAAPDLALDLALAGAFFGFDAPPPDEADLVALPDDFRADLTLLAVDDFLLDPLLLDPPLFPFDEVLVGIPFSFLFDVDNFLPNRHAKCSQRRTLSPGLQIHTSRGLS